jgi:hypothetical protein
MPNPTPEKTADLLDFHHRSDMGGRKRCTKLVKECRKGGKSPTPGPSPGKLRRERGEQNPGRLGFVPASS